MNQHTDERDAYEHIVRQTPAFFGALLNKYPDGIYTHATIQFGWQVYQKTRLMSISEANHA